MGIESFEVMDGKAYIFALDYKTYGIKPGDKMYVKPDMRAKIW